MKVNIDTLKENERNPRSITEAKMELLIDSILTFPKMLGLRPIVVDGDMTVLGGNMRTRALKRIAAMDIEEIKARLSGHNDYEKKNDAEKREIVCHWTLWLDARLVEVARADELSEEERQRFIIEDNASFGQWDYDMLANEWNSEDLNNWGVDVWNSEAEEENTESGVASEDDFDEEKDCIEVRCKKGDIWQLGEHRLMCGDSTSQTDVAELMDGHKADMIFTDPPYNVAIGSKNAALNKAEQANRITTDIAGDKGMTDEECGQKLWKPAFINLRENAKDDCAIYMTMPQGGTHMMMMMMMMMEAGWQVKHELIWLKNRPAFSMGRLNYDYKHEPILYGWNKSHNFYGKGEQQKSVWEFPVSNCDLHPTMKPVALVANALLNSSKVGDCICDLFGGSGTTLIACEQLNRKCFMMELDPHYCDVIIARWEKLTGKTATRIETESQ